MQTFSFSPRHIHQTFVTHLIAFSTISFIIGLGDAIMSYISPNFIEGIVDNPVYMGLIMSTSSMIGLICDFLFSHIFKEKSFFKYLFFAIIFAIIFPLIFIIKSSIMFVLIAMGIWGIYYELISFAKSNYVHHCLPHDHHDTGWAYLTAFTSLAYIIGPSMAVALEFLNPKMPLVAVIMLQVVALMVVFIYRLVFSSQIHDPIAHESHSSRFLKGFSVWGVLNKKLWPVLVFMFCLMLLDSAFWTVGAILVDSLKDTHRFASLLYVVYLLPFLFMGPVGIKLSKFIGKKRTAFLSGSVAGVFLCLTTLSTDFTIFLTLITIASLLIAIATPEIRGAVEDYCERLGENSNSLVGLTSSMGSLAYIIGPILSGSIASLVGEQKTFAVMGGLLIVVSILSLAASPKKIRLPQQELYGILNT